MNVCSLLKNWKSLIDLIFYFKHAFCSQLTKLYYKNLVPAFVKSQAENFTDCFMYGFFKLFSFVKIWKSSLALYFSSAFKSLWQNTFCRPVLDARLLCFNILLRFFFFERQACKLTSVSFIQVSVEVLPAVSCNYNKLWYSILCADNLKFLTEYLQFKKSCACILTKAVQLMFSVCQITWSD